MGFYFAGREPQSARTPLIGGARSAEPFNGVRYDSPLLCLISFLADLALVLDADLAVHHELA